MSNVQFYHLTVSALERALPKLLEKATGAGFRVLLVASSDERVEQLNQLLWTYDPNSFLAHGSTKDGDADQQPILLSTRVEPANGARLLAVTDGALPEEPEAFERILDLFDGNDAQATDKARARWKRYKDLGHSVTYMKQTEIGWEKAA